MKIDKKNHSASIRQIAGVSDFFQDLLSYFREKEKIFIISQNDNKKTNWELFVIMLALYNSFSIPFDLAFNPAVLQTGMMVAFDYLTDMLFIIDIFLQFRTSFYHPLTGDEIKDLKVIKQNYFRGRFTIDLLSSVPFDSLIHLVIGIDNKALRLLSLLKLFRVTRLSRIIARLNVSQDTKNTLKLSQLIFFIILYIHCSGCAWFAIVNYD